MQIVSNLVLLALFGSVLTKPFKVRVLLNCVLDLSGETDPYCQPDILQLTNLLKKYKEISNESNGSEEKPKFRRMFDEGNEGGGVEYEELDSPFFG